MKRIATLLGVALAIGSLSLGLLAQNELEEFWVGTTRMAYEVWAEEMGEPQILELTITETEDGHYTVSMFTEASGTADQLAGFGFIFGAASVRYGGGHDVSYEALGDLMERRDRLEESEEGYLLRGGGTFEEVVAVTIADVLCLQGVFIESAGATERTILAFALSHPVFISPRIRMEELRNGEWVDVFSMELVEYSYAAPEG